MTKKNSGYVWYELMTTHVAAAKQFYGDVVGWTTEEMAPAGVPYTILYSGPTLGVGGMMEMPAEMRARGIPPRWIGYVHAEDVDAAAAQVRSLGGRVHREPEDIPNVGRFAVVADPTGATFHLFKSDKPGERVSSTTLGDVGWRELHTTDWPRAFEFYAALCGWSKGNSVDMGPLGTYQLFTVDGVDNGAMFNSPAAATGSFWLYYFNVADIKTAEQRVVRGGGKVVSGPHDVPGGGSIIQALDPQGVMFALYQPGR